MCNILYSNLNICVLCTMCRVSRIACGILHILYLCYVLNTQLKESEFMYLEREWGWYWIEDNPDKRVIICLNGLYLDFEGAQVESDIQVRDICIGILQDTSDWTKQLKHNTGYAWTRRCLMDVLVHFNKLERITDNSCFREKSLYIVSPRHMIGLRSDTLIVNRKHRKVS